MIVSMSNSNNVTTSLELYKEVTYKGEINYTEESKKEHNHCEEDRKEIEVFVREM